MNIITITGVLQHDPELRDRHIARFTVRSGTNAATYFKCKAAGPLVKIAETLKVKTPVRIVGEMQYYEYEEGHPETRNRQGVWEVQVREIHKGIVTSGVVSKISWVDRTARIEMECGTICLVTGELFPEAIRWKTGKMLTILGELTYVGDTPYIDVFAISTILNQLA